MAERPAPAKKTVAAEARSRRAVGFTHVVASLLLAAGIAVMINYLSFRHYQRWDWTEAGVFTLSERTVKELEALTEPIDIYVFLTRGEANYPEVRELLDRYGAVTDRVTVHWVDPDRDPSEFQMLAQRFDVRAMLSASGAALPDIAAVVTRGDRKWTITRPDITSYDFSSFDDEDGVKIDVKVEQAFTGAIVQVQSGEATRVCVSDGHGEWSLDPGADRSISSLKEELARENVEVEAVDLAGNREVPEGCHALFVIGPTRPFSDDEAARLLAYLDGGGNALFALDPHIQSDRVQPTGLEGILAEAGVQVDETLVLELDPNLLLPPGNALGPYLVARYGAHRTVEGFGTAPAILAMARSVRPVEGGGARVLLETSERAYAETDLSQLGPEADGQPAPDGADVRGPVSVAVAAQRGEGAEEEEDGHHHGGAGEPQGGRLVVIGDADWLTGDLLLERRFTNFDLAVGWTGWLTHREALISIQPKKIEAQPMTITEGDLDGLAFRLIVLMPGAMLLLGFAMWWSRRS